MHCEHLLEKRQDRAHLELCKATVHVGQVHNLVYIDDNATSKIDELLSCGFRPRGTLDDVELAAVRMFKDIPEVACVYSDDYMRRQRFLVMTTNQRYDDELMDRLIATEQRLRERTHVVATFDYIPRPLQHDTEIIPEGANLLYERGLDVFIGSPFVARIEESATSAAIA